MAPANAASAAQATSIAHDERQAKSLVFQSQCRRLSNFEFRHCMAVWGAEDQTPYRQADTEPETEENERMSGMTEEQKHEELKPCPFCGANPKLHRCDMGKGMQTSSVNCRCGANVGKCDLTAEAAWSSRIEAASFQNRVKPWMDSCFGPTISADKVERNHRFLEEALELVQASGCTREESLQLVNYVYGRPQGDINQEVGGVMVTLAAHCLAHGVDMHEAGEIELARIWGKIDQIRQKQASKPKNSPLPGAIKGKPAEGNTP
jgi:NTP pyrophosphatase (non-canonical NTP hydrolase)